MYNNLSLYYLNQLGIKPWVKRADSSEKVKLVILFPSNLSDKAHTLLQQMIKCIHVEQHELLLLPIQDSESLSQYKHQISQKIPLAILALGLMTAQLNLNCPMVSCDSPADLLLNASQKKKVFQELTYLNQIIAA